MKFMVTTNRYQISDKFLEKVANAAFSFLPSSLGEIELLLVSEARIRKLNQEYRKKDAVTDVLSFQLSEKPLTGQVFICYNKAKEQAKKYDKELKAEVALLLVHGILHIFGYDHCTEDEAILMENVETNILKLQGINR